MTVVVTVGFDLSAGDAVEEDYTLPAFIPKW